MSKKAPTMTHTPAQRKAWKRANNDLYLNKSMIRGNGSRVYSEALLRKMTGRVYEMATGSRRRII